MTNSENAPRAGGFGTDAPCYEDLAEVLEALGNANRLRLLHKLIQPQTLSDIELHPEQVKEGERADRNISRQAVRDHVRRLIEIGVLRMDPGPSHGGGRLATYQLHSPRLFGVVEEVRKLGRLQAPLPSSFDTAELPTGKDGEGIDGKGPCLVVVHGAVEGLVFRLGDERPGRWTAGRDAERAIATEWDPYVSSEHLAITSDRGDEFFVEDLGSNLNGTWLNFRRLRRGERARIAHGDVIGLGKSLLLFRTR